MTRNISIFIPAYNEEANIEDVVREADNVLKDISGSHEIVVLNDGSLDNTGAILDYLMKQIPRLKVISHEKNKGIGAALVKGFSVCKGDYIFFNSADKQAPMSHLLKMLTHVDSCDLIIGHFAERKDSFWRIFLSRGYHLLVRIMFGIDIHNINALKLFKRDIFDPRHKWGENLCIDTEIAVFAKRRGFRICEITLEHFPRIKGKSSIVNLKNTLLTFYNLFGLFIKLNLKESTNVK